MGSCGTATNDDKNTEFNEEQNGESKKTGICLNCCCCSNYKSAQKTSIIMFPDKFDKNDQNNDTSIEGGRQTQSVIEDTNKKSDKKENQEAEKTDSIEQNKEEEEKDLIKKNNSIYKSTFVVDYDAEGILNSCIRFPGN